MVKYRKKPVVVDAIQYTPDLTFKSLLEWAGFEYAPTKRVHHPFLWTSLGCVISIDTLEGTMNALPGDWIIKEPFATDDRKFYPCKPDIFEATYALVEDEISDIGKMLTT